MKKFLIKIFILNIPVILICALNLYFDTFNVFHWKDVRFLGTESNNNFVKTSYVLNKPKKFNAFIFGSSRVQWLPPDLWPSENDGVELRWYNMTSSMAIPAENYMTLKTFLDKNVDIKMLALGFDDLSFYLSLENHKNDLMRVPYQEIMKNKIRYLAAFLSIKTDKLIVKKVLSYDKKKLEERTKVFYDWGGGLLDLSLTENPDLAKYELPETMAVSRAQAKESAVHSLKAIFDLCAERGIKLVLFTNALYQSTYKRAVDQGYFDLLRSVAKNCEFYNFSSLNNFTKDPRYYFEYSHYRPALGILMEKILFGTDEERAQIRNDAGDEMWGMKVNAQNIEQVVAHLQAQLEKQ